MENKLPLSSVFPLAGFTVLISTNSPSLHRYLERACPEIRAAAKTLRLSFEIYEGPSGKYYFQCPSLKFDLLIHNRSRREQNWCVMETVKILSLYRFLEEGVLFLHASAIVHQGQGFVFAGFSGSGKSTISDIIPDGKMADDQTVLAKDAAGYRIYSSVFDAKLKHPVYDGVPLGGIFLLVQSEGLSVTPITGMESVLSFLVNNDLFNAAFEFYLNQSARESRLHFEIAHKLYRPQFREHQFQHYLQLFRRIRLSELRFPRTINREVLLTLLSDQVAKRKKGLYH